jgi:hypothetical protein
MSFTNYAVTAFIAALFTKCLPDHAGIYLLTALGGILLAKLVSSRLVSCMRALSHAFPQPVDNRS